MRLDVVCLVRSNGVTIGQNVLHPRRCHDPNPAGTNADALLCDEPRRPMFGDR